ncbi:PapD-like protein [Venustampulla echinocandica]|uniref:PapD-like protein n=1 Tax=Venustampulla echinocandica TaxID=2656787 RepID=A0A370TQM7_9HELO|nr:PapD-like protein [Venustampulla echinocandica]RDL37836.1 PapD-like protein [Venustampulla echinocandica]
MSVEIEPVELGFHRPFTQEVSQILKIKNPNHTPVAFKVKTTAPKQYCVRPNSGTVQPGQEVDVTVLLQAMKQEPAPDAKCKDKFLVQSVAVTADKEFSGNVWQHVDDAERSQVQEKKIRVVYLAAEGATAAATPLRNSSNGIPNAATPDIGSAAYSNARSPSPETFTPENTRRSLAPKAAVSKTEYEPVNRRLSDIKAPVDQPATESTPTAPAAPLSYDELKTKLAEAQATISSYAQEGSLRMRKVAKGETSNETVNDMMQRAPTSQGVPLQIVAALCLVSFLLAYIFF